MIKTFVILLASTTQKLTKILTRYCIIDIKDLKKYYFHCVKAVRWSDKLRADDSQQTVEDEGQFSCCVLLMRCELRIYQFIMLSLFKYITEL